MIEKVKQLLLSGIDGEALMNEISVHFYEMVEDTRKSVPKLFAAMNAYASLRDFFDMDTDGLSYDEILTLDDLMEDIEYALQLRFDLVEDSVKKELIEGRSSQEVIREMKAEGIIPIGTGTKKLTEDEVEEFYMEAFQEFDEVRANIFRGILKLSPMEFYHKGEDAIEKQKKSKGLLMDERNFIDCFMTHFDKNELYRLFARRIYEAFHLHRRYQLEDFDMSDMPKDPDEDDYSDEYVSDEEMDRRLSAPSESDGILEPVGDLDPVDYTFVYEFLGEYTGHRVLPSDDDRVEEAYWSTYSDDFGDLLGLFMIDALEKTIKDLNENQSLMYETLAKSYHWNKDQRTDPEVILSTSDKISFALSDLQENLWMDFNEADLMPYYQAGKKIAEENQEVFDPEKIKSEE